MATNEEVRQAILDRIDKPQFVSSDAGTVRMPTLKEQVEAARDLAAQECTPTAGKRPFAMYSMTSRSTGYDVRP